MEELYEEKARLEKRLRNDQYRKFNPKLHP